MPSEADLESFIVLVETNANDVAIERFYAEDATIQENSDPPRRGRDTLIAGEHAFLVRWAQVRSRCIRPVFRAGDRVVIRWNFEFTAGDGSVHHMDEISWQRWHGNRIVEERFYYDPAQMRGSTTMNSFVGMQATR